MNPMTNRSALAKSIGLKGAVAGCALALMATVPSLIASAMKGTVILMTLSLVVGFLLVGAWFPTICRLSDLDPGEGSKGEATHDRSPSETKAGFRPAA